MSSLGIIDEINKTEDSTPWVKNTLNAFDMLTVKSRKDSVNNNSKLSGKDSKGHILSCIDSQGKMSALGIMDEINTIPK